MYYNQLIANQEKIVVIQVGSESDLHVIYSSGVLHSFHILFHSL